MWVVCLCNSLCIQWLVQTAWYLYSIHKPLTIKKRPWGALPDWSILLSSCVLFIGFIFNLLRYAIHMKVTNNNDSHSWKQELQPEKCFCWPRRYVNSTLKPNPQLYPMHWATKPAHFKVFWSVYEKRGVKAQAEPCKTNELCHFLWRLFSVGKKKWAGINDELWRTLFPGALQWESIKRNRLGMTYQRP